jgi:hypothetical protein
LTSKKRNKNQSNKQKQRFYTRSIKLPNINFTKEQTILNYGLQRSIEKPLTIYWWNLIMETKRAVKLLDGEIQTAFCILATKKLKQIYNNNITNKSTTKILMLNINTTYMF